MSIVTILNNLTSAGFAIFGILVIIWFCLMLGELLDSEDIFHGPR